MEEFPSNAERVWSRSIWFSPGHLPAARRAWCACQKVNREKRLFIRKITTGWKRRTSRRFTLSSCQITFAGSGPVSLTIQKRWSQVLLGLTQINIFSSLDTSEEENPHTHEEESSEGGSNYSSELHSESISDQRLQVWLQNLCFSDKHQSTAHLPLQRWFGEVIYLEFILIGEVNTRHNSQKYLTQLAFSSDLQLKSSV